MNQDSTPSDVHSTAFVYTIDLRPSRLIDGLAKAAAPPHLGVKPAPTMPSTSSNAPLLAVVTAADIGQARRDRSAGCPIAVALSRIFGRTALVAYETLWRVDGSRVLTARATVGQHSWELPPHALEFMRRADQGCEVKPITFELPEVRP